MHSGTLCAGAPRFGLFQMTLTRLLLLALAARPHQLTSQHSGRTCLPYSSTAEQCTANGDHHPDTPSSWVDIQGAGDASQVYSAYRLSDTLVRAVSILSRTALQRVWCHHLDGDYDHLATPSRSSVRILKYDENKPYVVAFVDCGVRADMQPEYLALTTTLSPKIAAEPGRVVPIFDRRRSAASSTTSSHPCLGVCTRVYGGAMHNDVTARDVAEFVEHHRHNGFSHFTFYTTAVNDDVNNALAFYASSNAVTVHKFEPRVKAADIHELGQVAVINDCHLRNRGRYTLFLQADVDEFVVPRTGMDIKKELTTLLSDRAHPIEIGLQSSFIYVAKNDTQRLRTTSREIMIYPYTWRSKYVARTDDVEEAGIHELFVTRLGDAAKNRHIIPPSTAVLHHYRRADIHNGAVVNDIPSITGQAMQPTMEDASMVAHLARYEDCIENVLATAAVVPARVHKFAGRVLGRKKGVSRSEVRNDVVW